MASLTVTLEKFDNNLWQYHFPIPDDIAESFIVNENKRVICEIATIKFRAALMKSKDYWFVLINQALREKLGLNQGEQAMLSLVKDKSEFGHEMPEELQVLLDQDDTGNQYFRSLTMGKQRSLVYIVTKVKNSNSRLNKALAIVEHLKDVKGVLDFKMLNEKIKHYNNLNKH
ncbi:YdeI/OmpD-associated family protein [Echinicola sp. 20G]|uniref:YdeI/OmpD-associated family protein n=1 Tax=Echinicola sp. 20G TaxID=2781961 RepID=UPI001911138A|nr:YdeI/OmpD-associated family protein [Echinicola sp. 20G]